MTLVKFQVPEAEQRDVVAFVRSLKNDCVECSEVWYGRGVPNMDVNVC